MGKDLDYTDIGAYLVSISKRIANLEVDSVDLKEEVDGKDESIKKLQNEFKEDLQNFRTQVTLLRNELSGLTGEISSVVKEFNTVARKSSLDRLNRKIEEWSPEKLATHKDVARLMSTLDD